MTTTLKTSALLGLAVVFNPCNFADASPETHSRMLKWRPS
jgi:hypothetical protein